MHLQRACSFGQAGAKLRAVGLAHIYMNGIVIKEGIGSALGELHKVCWQNKAAYEMIGHGAHCISRDDPRCTRFFCGRDDGMIIYFVRWQMAFAMARYENHSLSFHPGVGYGDFAIRRFDLIGYPIKAKSHSTNDCQLSVHGTEI